MALDDVATTELRYLHAGKSAGVVGILVGLAAVGLLALYIVALSNMS